MIRVEIAYAIDPFARTARIIEQDHERDYSRLTPTEFGGRGDLFGIKSGMPTYTDFKTGQDVGDLAEFMQCRFFATALHLETGEERIGARIAYVQPDSSLRFTTHIFREMDFLATLEQLRRLHKHREAAIAQVAKGLPPDVRAGDWCTYCPGFMACPQKVTMVRLLGGTTEELAAAEPHLMALSDEALARAWQKYTDIKDIFKRVEKGLKEVAKARTIPLPEGRIVRPITKSRPGVNGEKALQLAKEYGATQREMDDCKYLITYDEVRETKR